jgi:hypothetical protein
MEKVTELVNTLRLSNFSEAGGKTQTYAYKILRQMAGGVYDSLNFEQVKYLKKA